MIQEVGLFLPSPAPGDEWALQGQWWALSFPGLQPQEIRNLKDPAAEEWFS